MKNHPDRPCSYQGGSVHAVLQWCSKITAVLLASLLLMNSASASGLPVATPEEQGMSSARFRLLTNLLRQYVEEGKVAGLVAGVSRNGHIVYLESMGSQEIHAEQRVPMQADSIFQIRSMSKPIVSLAAMQLIESGQLRLNDPVAMYIPSFAEMRVFENPEDFENSATIVPSRQLTIEDLLLHTGGLSHRDDPLYRSHQVRSRADTLEQLVEKVAAVPLMADPGKRWIYSISTTVLGRVVEIVSGAKLDEYLVQNILGPLQMADTGFYVSPERVGRLARIYQIPREGRPLEQIPEMDIPITVNPPLLEGAAGMVSTVPDYLRFLQAFLNNGELDGARVLSSAGVAAMTQNQLPAAVMPIGFSARNPMRDTGWGYGFSVITDNRHSAFAVNNGEFGWNGSLGTFSWADPQTGTVAVLMLQVVPSGAYGLSGLFKSLVAQTIIE
jgi:CubicO group peptidase (beta-lactamase class C family)